MREALGLGTTDLELWVEVFQRIVHHQHPPNPRFRKRSMTHPASMLQVFDR